MQLSPTSFTSALILSAALVSCSPKRNEEVANAENAAESAAASAIDFSWRSHEGDFPKDKPGYLILTTEDAVTYSKVLPAFVKQKEAMGFYVYVATEKDYGTGKVGNPQAAQVRAWMREFNKRAGLQYALLIGNSNRNSSDLPSPTIPDGERGGMEEAYADLDGAWVDLYLNTKEVDKRSAWTQMCAGSVLKPKFLKQGGGRKDELIMSRISYVGNEVGHGAYDLDKILDKTIRYEQDTVAGKNLDWRGHTLSVLTNYGSSHWDNPLIKALEVEGGSFEWHSQLGINGAYVPENIFDGRAANAELMHQNRRRGLVSTVSHGWSRGGEGVMGRDGVLRGVDDRWPSVYAVAACTAYDLGDNGNTGQTWLRKGAVFACGTGWSGNNNSRVPMLRSLIEKRSTTGEAVRNTVVTYGDPSLRVFPPVGTPLRALRLEPAFNAHYEQRILRQGQGFKPIAAQYKLTNESKEEMQITIECDAAWLTLSEANVTLKPGASVEVTANSNEIAQKLAPATHIANVRFLRSDGQRDERRVAFQLQPVTLSCAYSFDTAVENNRFSDVGTKTPAKNAWHDKTALWLNAVQRGPHWKPFVKVGDKVPGYAAEPLGKVGGALRLDHSAKAFGRGLTGPTQWRGATASLWFKVDALPEAKKVSTILAAPFTLTLDDKGMLSFANSGDKPAALGQIQPGQWHFVQVRSAVESGQVKARLDGQSEVTTAAVKLPGTALNLGVFAGALDELKTWSGELSDADMAREFADAGKPFAMPADLPATNYADDGVLRAPKETPAVFNMSDATKTLDLSNILAAAGLECTALRDAPEWLELKSGVLALKEGADFDSIDFGGYDCFLALKAKDGRVCEHSLKVCIPVPEIRIRIKRAADNSISIACADPKRKLAKGVIRYTTDGSLVTAQSPVYEKPFKATGDKVSARFFYLNEYPYAPVSLGTEFGMPRDHWKVIAVSGNRNLANTQVAFDGLNETAWRHAGGKLPQFFAWDLGAASEVTKLSVHSTIKDQNGRIKGYILHASDDGKTWRKVKEGELDNSPNAVRITLDAACTARYLKLEATSLYAGKDMVITELDVFTR